MDHIITDEDGYQHTGMKTSAVFAQTSSLNSHPSTLHKKLWRKHKTSY